MTYGELIHNPLEIKRLKNDYNVGYIESLEKVDAQKIIIRTHGITKEDREKLESQGK